MQKTHRSSKKGFTLIELLIVIAIIGFIAAAILVAVDPVKRVQSARDSQRWSEVNGVLNAILKKQVDDGSTYSGVSTTTVAAAQVSTATLSGSGTTGTYGVTINGLQFTTSQTGTPATDAATLEGLISADTTLSGVVSTGVAGAVITVTADVAGTAFDISNDGTVLGTDAAVAIATTTANAVDATAAAIDNTQTTIQVLVADASATDCTTAGSFPSCEDGLAYGNLPNTGTDCVANISTLAPEYIAEIPVDPIGSGNYPDGYDGSSTVAFGTQNSGYFINRVGSGQNKRLSVGACWGEQDNAIVVQR